MSLFSPPPPPSCSSSSLPEYRSEDSHSHLGDSDSDASEDSAGGPDINRGRWNKEEDEKLKRLVEVHGERWDFVASHFPDRADVQCQHRWQKVVNPELVKGKEKTNAFPPSVLKVPDGILHLPFNSLS